MSRFAQEKDPEILHKAIDLLQNHNRALATKIAELLKELAEAKGDSGLQQLRIAALEKSLAKLTKEIFGPSTEQRPASATADSNDEDDKSKDEKTRRERARCAWIPRADFFGEMREQKCASVRFFREGIR